MEILRLSRAGSVAVFASLLLATIAAVAKDGRDFAGFYSLTDVHEQGEQVQVTLGLQIFNYSGADLRQAVVTVRQSHPGIAVLGTSAPIELWRANARVIVKQDVTLSRDEFERWSGHSQPAVFVVYRDASGQERQAWTQLSQRPAVPF